MKKYPIVFKKAWDNYVCVLNTKKYSLFLVTEFPDWSLRQSEYTHFKSIRPLKIMSLYN